MAHAVVVVVVGGRHNIIVTIIILMTCKQPRPPAAVIHHYNRATLHATSQQSTWERMLIIISQIAVTHNQSPTAQQQLLSCALCRAMPLNNAMSWLHLLSLVAARRAGEPGTDSRESEWAEG